jgi:hypothetical protein
MDKFIGAVRYQGLYRVALVFANAVLDTTRGGPVPERWFRRIAFAAMTRVFSRIEKPISFDITI